MPNVLEVQIVGDVSGLEKSLKQAGILQYDYTKAVEKTSSELKANIAVTNGYKKAIEDLNNEYKKGSVSSGDYQKQLANLKRDEKESTVVTANLRKELSSLKREQKDLGAVSKGAADGVQSIGKAGANATPTLIEFSRVIQDAPYGVQGVANNIQQLSTNFVYLKQSAGGTLPALKALAGSFLGPAGLIFLVSTITSLLVTYGDELFSTANATNKLSDATKDGIGEARAEVAVVNSLISVLQSETSSREAKLKAYNKLQEIQPSILQGLTFEQAQTANLRDRVDELTASLIRQAKVKGFQDLLTEKYAELADLGNKAGKETATLTDNFVALLKSAAQVNAGLNRTFDQELEVAGLETAKENARAITKEIIKLEDQLKDIVKIDAESSVSKILDVPEAKAKKAKKVKPPNVTPQLTSLIDQLKAEDFIDLKSIEVATGKVDEFGLKISTFTDDLVDLKSIAVFTGKVDEYGNKLKEIAQLTIPQITIRPIVDSEFISSLERAKAEAEIYSTAIGASIGEIGGQIARTFETGNAVIDAFVGSLISSLAQIAQAQITSLITEQAIATAKIGTNQAVSTSNAVTAATSTAAASGPAAAFVLPALVGAAIGFIAASFAGIKFAHGGVVPGGSFTGDKVPAMLNSGEAVMNSQQQANVLMAIANGNSNSLQSNRTIDTFEISSVLRGSDLLLSIERQKRKR